MLTVPDGAVRAPPVSRPASLVLERHPRSSIGARCASSTTRSSRPEAAGRTAPRRPRRSRARPRARCRPRRTSARGRRRGSAPSRTAGTGAGAAGRRSGSAAAPASRSRLPGRRSPRLLDRPAARRQQRIDAQRGRPALALAEAPPRRRGGAGEMGMQIRRDAGAERRSAAGAPARASAPRCSAAGSAAGRRPRRPGRRGRAARRARVRAAAG